ncbi:hypothetical protein pb186bvf_000017 [Paramecium bursaria]
MLICNELSGKPCYPELMELYNRVINLDKIAKYGLIICGQQIEFDVLEHINNTKIALDSFISNLIESDSIIAGHRMISSSLAQLKKSMQQQQVQEEIVPKEQLVIKRMPKINQMTEEELNNEIQNELYNIVVGMKVKAINIHDQLKQDTKVIGSITNKQDKNSNILNSSNDKLKEFNKSKSLSCSSLFLLTMIAIGLFVFTVGFIIVESKVSWIIR